jgi:hypothetical protein
MLPAVATSVHLLELQILGLTFGCRLLHMSDDLFHVSDGGSDLIRWMEMQQTSYRGLVIYAIIVDLGTSSYDTRCNNLSLTSHRASSETRLDMVQASPRCLGKTSSPLALVMQSTAEPLSRRRRVGRHGWHSRKRHYCTSAAQQLQSSFASSLTFHLCLYNFPI